jgi:hypothetical protein
MKYETADNNWISLLIKIIYYAEIIYTMLNCRLLGINIRILYDILVTTKLFNIIINIILLNIIRF